MFTDGKSRRRILGLALGITIGAMSVAPAMAGTAAKSPASGKTGPLTAVEMRQAEQRLADLGYWTGPVDGRIDEVTRAAVIAFQKIDGRKPTGQLTRRDLAALNRSVPPFPRESGPAHIEVDLGRQVLFFVDGTGRVAHILPVSSGSGKTFHEKGYPETHAVTPCGHLEVFSKAAGWKKSPLGEMFNPLYIVGGIAIHGSLDVPAHPASHGCIRVPMFASHQLPRMVPLKTPVLVYGCRDEAPVPVIASAAE
jgi:lipoprotein-anchoring transpeptidase ErfK/SrfK